MPERDRDRAVDRLLREAMTSGAGTASPACLDGESIAAWTAGAMAPGEAAEVERHVAGCARCQAVVATLIRSTPTEPAAPPAWSRWRLPWLVPIATAATAAALWFALPGRGPVPFAPEPAADTVARQAPPPEFAPQVESRAPESSPAQKSEAPGPAAPPLDTRLPDRADASATIGRVAQLERREANEESRPPASPAESDVARDQLAKSVSGVRQEASAAAASEVARRNLAAVVGSAIDVIAATGTARWRISGGRQVEWSTSAGSTWESAALTSSDDLTAGSAPSASTCWLVGRRGAVYLTTDGVRFTRLAFPEPVDLVRVAAVDDRTASVTATDGRSWHTADQGRTWASK